MKLRDIIGFSLINDVSDEKVIRLAESIKENGFIGCPILVAYDSLLTGSHRLAALKYLVIDLGMNDLLDADVAEDVTEIVEEHILQRIEDGYGSDIQYDSLRWYLSGSWVENYKDEIEEW